jgi:hypothetical protein
MNIEIFFNLELIASFKVNNFNPRTLKIFPEIKIESRAKTGEKIRIMLNPNILSKFKLIIFD